MSLGENFQKYSKEKIMGLIFEVLEKNPDKNIERLFSLVKFLSKDEDSKQGVEDVEKFYNEIPSVRNFINDILINTNKNCLKRFSQNFFANGIWNGIPKREKFKDKDTKVPFVLLISPSMKCNLRCTGCYAGEYEKSKELTYDEVDDIVGQAHELGIHYIIILGGEPFFVDFMWKIYEKYKDIEFTPFTNGTLITEEVADRIASLGNIIPMFSLEGYERETDMRRGIGTFKKVMEGMDLLKERGVPFGVSSAVSRNNADIVVSDDFIDMLISKGSRMSWYFMYMPVGISPDIKNMLTPEQRIKLGKRAKSIRVSKPYFTIDFFNDAPYVGGCIAGKYYCHINSAGDVEPCIFAHIATDNIRDKKLIDIFRSFMFRELRNRQPYNKNMLRPCMMVDNPQVIREVAKLSGAYTTDESAKAMLYDEGFQRELEKLAENYAPYADEVWRNDFNCQGNDKFAKG